jgi:hypothetical protein
LESFRRVHSIGFQSNLNFCAQPVAFAPCARFSRWRTISLVLFYFALPSGTDRESAPSPRLKGMLSDRLYTVR